MKPYTINTLLLSGGGAKGISYCGLIKKLEELQTANLGTTDCVDNTPIQIDIRTVCGISIGSIFGLLYSIGYRSEELQTEILSKNFEELKDIKFSNFIKKFGLESGKGIIEWIGSLLERRGYNKDITFNQLYKKTGICLRVLAGNLRTYGFTEFDHINTPRVKVLRAIRLSISLPFIFTSQKYKNDIHIDGGIIDNYPIYMFRDTMDTVLGVKLIFDKVEIETDDMCDENKNNTNCLSMDKYIYEVLKCYAVQRERLIIKSSEHKQNTLFIYTRGFTDTINFAMDSVEKQTLIDIGYEAADNFFKTRIETINQK